MRYFLMLNMSSTMWLRCDQTFPIWRPPADRQFVLQARY